MREIVEGQKLSYELERDKEIGARCRPPTFRLA